MSIKRFNEFPDGSGNLTSDDIFLFMDDPSNGASTKKISLAALADVLDVDGISNNYISSNTTDIIGASSISNIIQISQSNYDAIPTPDPQTLYIIVG